MNGRRAIVGLCMLCALLISAFAAQSAVAANGTTGFTCKDNGGTTFFTDAHCTTGVNGKYEHVAIAQDLTTEVEITNAKTNAGTTGPSNSGLHATVGGTEFELVSTTVTGTGSCTNKLDEPSKEHYIHCENAKLVYTGITEAKLGCGVEGLPGGVGKIETKELTATTTGKGDSVVFSPLAPATLFAEFKLTGCAVANTYKVVGSVTCKPEGATINCSRTETTTAGALRLGSAIGPKAGLNGKVTISGRAKGVGAYTPLSPTTVT